MTSGAELPLASAEATLPGKTDLRPLKIFCLTLLEVKRWKVKQSKGKMYPSRGEMPMVMVATVTRRTAACPLCEEVRCAQDGVSGVEGDGGRVVVVGEGEGGGGP